MQTKTKEPSLAEDIGSIAGLYKTVFWMIGQRLQKGRDWENQIAEDTLRAMAIAAEERRELVAHRN